MLACPLTIPSASFAVFTVPFVCSIISFTTFWISLAAPIEPSANLRISSATTANPLPASPALAASIEAFRESKLVSSEISLITSINFTIDADFSSKIRILSTTFCVISDVEEERFDNSSIVPMPSLIIVLVLSAICIISSTSLLTTSIFLDNSSICSKQLCASSACWEIPCSISLTAVEILSPHLSIASVASTILCVEPSTFFEVSFTLTIKPRVLSTISPTLPANIANSSLCLISIITVKSPSATLCNFPLITFIAFPIVPATYTPRIAAAPPANITIRKVTVRISVALLLINASGTSPHITEPFTLLLLAIKRYSFPLKETFLE